MHSTSSDESGRGARGRFVTTHWSLVLAAGIRGSAAAEEALARLCSLYWYPIFAFVRRQGYTTDEAQDLTQGFFARLIEKGELGDADRARGRFRSFLITACEHFLSNERDRAEALKRGGGMVAVPIDIAAVEARYQRALSHSETPERLYDRQWCLTLLGSVLEEMREEYVAAGNERVFDRLRGFLTVDEASESHAGAAEELNMTTVAVKVAVHRMRRRYREALRQRIADTVASSAEIDEEIRYLLETLSQSHAAV